MIGHMRHGSPPRLMALQSILSPNRRESLPAPSAGVRITSLSARADAPSPPAPLMPPSPKVQPPSPTALHKNVQQLRDQWMQCTAAAAKADLRSSRPAEAVADAALQRCKSHEQPLARALNRQLGKD